MSETTHQHHGPMEWFGQASAAEPQPLLVCQYCGFVRDDASGDREQPATWMAMGAYRKKTAVQLRDLPFVHTYCPSCASRIQANTIVLRNPATTSDSLRTPMRVRIDRGWLTFIKSMVERRWR